jgi:hypothetical protein
VDPPCDPPICSHEQPDLCRPPRCRNSRGVSDHVSQLQRLINAYRYTQNDLSLHQKVLKLVLTFKTTLEAFSSDPKVLSSFIAHVSAYMRPNLWFYSGEITTACKFSPCSKTRRFSVAQKQYLAILAPGTHPRRSSTTAFCISWKEHSGFQSPDNSLLSVPSSLDRGLRGQFRVSIS